MHTPVTALVFTVKAASTAPIDFKQRLKQVGADQYKTWRASRHVAEMFPTKTPGPVVGTGVLRNMMMRRSDNAWHNASNILQALQNGTAHPGDDMLPNVPPFRARSR